LVSQFKVTLMKDYKYHNNLEQFLQSEIENHKLFPEDKIWRNIYKEFHGNKKWSALAYVSLFIIVALTLSTLIYNNPTNTTNFTNSSLISTNVITKNSSIEANNIIGVQLLNNKHSYPIKSQQNNYLVSQLPTNIIDNSTITSEAATTTFNNNEVLNDSTIPSSLVTNNNISLINITNEKIIKPEIERINNKIIELTNKPLKSLNETKNTKSKYTENLTSINQFKNSFKANKPKPTKFELQVYATPSISFRRLSDDKTRNYISFRNTNTSGPISSQFFTDVNDVVRHKPALGLEAGIGILYQLTDKIKLRTGFQLNMRKYYIDSYRSGVNVAQIAVVTNNGIDTVSQLSTESNTSGYATTTLKNRLYQVSIPIGIQWQVFQKNKFGISIGASIQPTLTLNKNVYLLSTDYKFYTDGTSFFRKWNINTDVDINFTYKIGTYNIFISPQVRYQHLPTYTNEYPIKEHRLDNGLRIGFTKQIFK